MGLVGLRTVGWRFSFLGYNHNKGEKMQTLTIRIDESYLEQIFAFLQQIPKNKREIFQHTKLNISPIKEDEDDFLTILANGPTISHNEVDEWEQNIKQGYKSWNIEEF
jgi:fructose-1-phosphate kinase PfkB-like protein